MPSQFLYYKFISIRPAVPETHLQIEHEWGRTRYLDFDRSGGYSLGREKDKEDSLRSGKAFNEALICDAFSSDWQEKVIALKSVFEAWSSISARP